MGDYFIVKSLIFAYFNFYFAILVVKHPVCRKCAYYRLIKDRLEGVRLSCCRGMDWTSENNLVFIESWKTTGQFPTF